jgi:hypothetical protein
VKTRYHQFNFIKPSFYILSGHSQTSDHLNKISSIQFDINHNTMNNWLKKSSLFESLFDDNIPSIKSPKSRHFIFVFLAFTVSLIWFEGQFEHQESSFYILSIHLETSHHLTPQYCQFHFIGKRDAHLIKEIKFIRVIMWRKDTVNSISLELSF